MADHNILCYNTCGKVDLMSKLFLIISFILILTADAYPSEIIEVQLPELHGLYSIEIYSRCAEFQLDRTPTTIHNVWIRLSGKVNVGQHMCDLGLGPQGPYPYPIEFFASMRDTVNIYFPVCLCCPC